MNLRTGPCRVVRLELPIACVLLTIMFGQLFYGAVQMGLAYDELFHISAGAATVDSGVRRLVLDHPPLGHYLAGLALKGLDPVYDRVQYQHADFARDGFSFGYAFFNANVHRFGQILLAARLPFMALCVVGGVYCYLLSRSFWGKPAAIFSLVLYVFSPALLAWNRFVYLDGLLASVAIAALSHLCWFLRSRHRGHLAATAFFSAATLCSKYSGVFIVPVVLAAVLLAPDWFGERQISLRQRSIEALAWTVGTSLLLWGAYGCPLDPFFYSRGAALIYSSAPPGYRFYLFGEFRPGWWYYYLVQWLVKSTLPSLLITAGLVAAVCFGLARRNHVSTRRKYWPALLLAGTAFSFLWLTSWKSLDIGARYLVPMVPMVCAASGALFDASVLPRRTMVNFGLWSMAVWHAWTTVRSFPDEMGYFNQLVGGSKRGIFVANDASLDAGQNLPRLARYLQRRGNPVVKLYYQGTDEPSRYGIRYQPVTQFEWDTASVPGLYAISSYPLAYGQLTAREKPNHRDWLNELKPVVVIGNSIWVYELR
ncbi:MAG TPA: glycosyltransferase family 39 protein [Polyangiaceae bacterium]|nr:glycosyltransferase family 39 protein [Polyangiaceae bacterium]